MFIKVFLIFLFLYNNSVFAESYIENLEIINDIGKPIQYHVEVAKTESILPKSFRTDLTLLITSFSCDTSIS